MFINAQAECSSCPLQHKRICSPLYLSRTTNDHLGGALLGCLANAGRLGRPCCWHGALRDATCQSLHLDAVRRGQEERAFGCCEEDKGNG